MRLLEFEHPLTPDYDRPRRAEAVCREARTLLQRDYGLFGDWPADTGPTQARPTDQGRVQRVLRAVRDYYRNAGKRKHGSKAFFRKDS
jgi:hypothetical protein